MELTEDEIIEKYGRQCGHCSGNTLLPYEYELTCVSSGYIVINGKHELSKIQRKKNFINRKKDAEQKIFCICVDVYKLFEGKDYDKIYKVSSTLKNSNFFGNSISSSKRDSDKGKSKSC